MRKCEVCGREADIHHIIHRCDGGLDFPLNYKYLCGEHHRGKNGPHRNSNVDIEYKLELQKKLETVLYKEYYTFDELTNILEFNSSKLKKLLKDFKLYKEGYKTSELIYRLMGNRIYDEFMLEEYNDFIAVGFSLL